jgi:hypothetical protein
LAEDIHAPRQTLQDLLGALHGKFGDNLEEAVNASTAPLLDTMNLNSRIISTFKAELIEKYEKMLINWVSLGYLMRFSVTLIASTLLNSIGIVLAQMSIREHLSLDFLSYTCGICHGILGMEKM